MRGGFGEKIYYILCYSGMYLDAGHGGWMSYERNLAGYADLIASMGVADKIRGFATNGAPPPALRLTHRPTHPSQHTGPYTSPRSSGDVITTCSTLGSPRWPQPSP